MWLLANEVNSLAVLSQQVRWSERKLNICKPSKEHVRTCKHYVIGRKITTVLKVAVDNGSLKLHDSCDYFASPILVENTN